jgi:UDP-N-acetyl-D-mannosaminuronic acid transferase (WecB/TagA/CpsF family)
MKTAGYSETSEPINQTTRRQILEHEYKILGIKIVLCDPQQLMHFVCRMSSILRAKIRDVLLSNEEIIFIFNKEFDIGAVGILENSELIRTNSCSL